MVRITCISLFFFLLCRTALNAKSHIETNDDSEILKVDLTHRTISILLPLTFFQKYCKRHNNTILIQKQSITCRIHDTSARRATTSCLKRTKFFYNVYFVRSQIAPVDHLRWFTSLRHQLFLFCCLLRWLWSDSVCVYMYVYIYVTFTFKKRVSV